MHYLVITYLLLYWFYKDVFVYVCIGKRKIYPGRRIKDSIKNFGIFQKSFFDFSIYLINIQGKITQKNL